MGKLNILIKFAKKAIVLALAFGAGFLFCLFKSNSSTDTKAIEVAVAEALANSADELKEAKADLKKKDAELEELKEKKVKSKANTNSPDATSSISKEDIYKEVVETIFYDIEGDFVMNNSEFKFYSDNSCTTDTLITDELKFITHRDVDGRNDSNFEVFISMSSKGPVYSTEKPYFDPAN